MRVIRDAKKFECSIKFRHSRHSMAWVTAVNKRVRNQYQARVLEELAKAENATNQATTTPTPNHPVNEPSPQQNPAPPPTSPPQEPTNITEQNISRLRQNLSCTYHLIHNKFTMASTSFSLESPSTILFIDKSWI